jgi:L-rhamnose mutarotase
MGKVIFTVKYEVVKEKTEQYLEIIKELKNIVKAEGLESYSVYSANGKKNIYQEVFIFENKEAFDNYDDATNERVDILMVQLADYVVPNTTEYLTLSEV